MGVADINVARPRYLNRTHELDYHWVVWDTKTGKDVMWFVRVKGTSKGKFVSFVDPLLYEVSYWDKYDHCTYALGQLSKEPWTILNDAKEAGIPKGNYKCSITRVNGQKLVSYEFTI